MKKLITLAATTLLMSPSLLAFDFQVKSIEEVPVKGAPEAYHPVFSADGKSLIVTSEGYDGLGIVSIADGKYRQLSDRAGAGYRFAQNADGSQLLVRENDFMTQKLSLYVVDVATGAEECVVPVAEHTNTLRLNDGVIAYAEPVEKRIVTRECRVSGHSKSSAVQSDFVDEQSAGSKASLETMLTEEDLKLVLYVDGKPTVVDPILATEGRDVNYCWSSLSPDGTKMLFVGGNDAYTCNLDGSQLVNLGPIHAPVWRGNDAVIGMLDSDDGHFFTASDIVAADARTAERVQLTPQTDEIKMFPSVSPDGNRIAFHTTEGKIYIINLENK